MRAVRAGVVLSMVVAVLSVGDARAGFCQFYTDEAAWLAAVEGVETYLTTNENLSQLPGVPDPLLPDTDLGTAVLSFPKAITGLSRSFTLTELESGATWWFETPGTPITDFLEPGDGRPPPPDRYMNDDWELVVTDGPDLHGFAFDLGDNGALPGIDTYYVYGSAGLICSTPAPVMPPYVRFLGVVSSTPIVRVEMDEDPGLDNIVIANFRFASGIIPEPATLSLLALGALALARRRRRK